MTHTKNNKRFRRSKWMLLSADGRFTPPSYTCGECGKRLSDSSVLFLGDTVMAHLASHSATAFLPAPLENQ